MDYDNSQSAPTLPAQREWVSFKKETTTTTSREDTISNTHDAHSDLDCGLRFEI